MIVWYGDEAGRGPLAGPIVCGWIGCYFPAGAQSILHCEDLLRMYPFLAANNQENISYHSYTGGYKDSKKLSFTQRSRCYHSMTGKKSMLRPQAGVLHCDSCTKDDADILHTDICTNKYIWSWGRKAAKHIDRMGIVHAQRDALFSSLWRGLRQMFVSHIYVRVQLHPLLRAFSEGKVSYSQKALLEICNACTSIGEEVVLIFDGKQNFMLDRISSRVMTIVQGDTRAVAMSLASILAKATRDQYMIHMHKQRPLYGFDQHKGYGTAKHRTVLKDQGTCPLHRKTFLSRICSAP